MKKILHYIIIAVIVFVVGCKPKENQPKPLPSNWLGYKQETIPFRLRQQNFEKGNLIPNPSFEDGKLYNIQNEQDAFNVPGWRKSGENVFWVNTMQPSFDSTEVKDGVHSIKISREKSDETEDVGEGVISDFIKVIPGKYSLSLNIKLKNIKPSKSRLGTKLYDAIDIRLIYYDKNKLEISPNQYSEYYQTNINTSNKWLSFAHFYKIDSLNWTNVFCESAYPPFPDGYVPDNARFVRVFIGLKGSGTMWIDNIEYKYTRDNFTLHERLEPYFTKNFDTYDLLLPVPKKIVKKNTVEIISDSTGNKEILIVQPKNSTAENSVEFNSLLHKLSKYSISKKNTLTIKDIDQFNLIISIGNTNIFRKTFKDSVFNQIEKNENQGYIIKSIENLPNVIFISSKSRQAVNYGINTLSQLIDTTKNKLYNADIIDWPEIENRFVIINSAINSSDFNDLANNTCFNYVFSKNNGVNNKLVNYQHGIIHDIDSSVNTLKNLNNIDQPILIKGNCKSIEKLNLNINNAVWYCSQFSQLNQFDVLDKTTLKYINSLQNLDVDRIIWKGTSAYSPCIDDLDYSLFTEHVSQPLVLSLPLIYYPYEVPVNANSLLALPVFKISGVIFKNISHLGFEVDSFSLLNKFRLLAMSCYTWDPEKYNADFVLYKILTKNLSFEKDRLKLISLSDRLNSYQWSGYVNEKKHKVSNTEYEKIVLDYKFEEKGLDSLILENISGLIKNMSY